MAALLLPAICFAVFAAGARVVVAQQATGVTIAVGDDVFLPNVERVPIGTTVTWRTDGTNGHTVTSDTGLFDSGLFPFLEQRDTFSFSFSEPGAYQYYCLYHGGPGGVAMSGVIVVEAREPTATSTGLPTAAPDSATPTPQATETPAGEPNAGLVRTNDDSGVWLLWAAVGVCGGVLVAGSAAVWWRRRRSRP